MLFKRKEIWVPTWKGWLLFFATVASLFYVTLRATAPFLAPVKPVNAPVLVIEGWISEAGLRKALELNSSNHYALIITAGQEIEKGMDISHYGNYAELAAARLINLGFAGTNLVKIPTPKTRRDRTYHTALAVRDYLTTNTTYRALDILSDSVHSRRTWLLYDIACRPEIKTGIIANINPDFDTTAWWKTSNGVRIVLNEAIGYLYAKLVFIPD